MSRLPALQSSLRARLGAAACVLALLATATAFAPWARAEKPVAETDAPDELPVWPADVVERFSALPVHAGGRVKPFSTWAKFRLLQLNFTSTMLTKAKEKRSAMEWALDTLFYPEIARHYRVLRIEDDAVLVDLGLRFEKRKKADRYAYAELEPALPLLRRKDARIRERMEKRGLEMKHLSRLDRDIVELARNVRDLEGVLTFFDFARKEVRTDLSPAIQAHFDGKPSVPVSAFIPKAEAVGRAVSGHGADDPAAAALAGDVALLRDMMDAVSRMLGGSAHPSTIPPAGKSFWSSPWQVTRDAYTGVGIVPEHLAAVEQMERLTAARDDPEQFAEAVRAFQTSMRALAEAGGVYDKIEMEVHFYAFDPFGKALWIYLLAFLLVAISWFRPRATWLQWVIYAAVAIALLLQIYGIVLRSVIRDRPPIKNLYDTVVFIGGTGVLTCLIMEWVSRKRVAIAVAPVLGALLLFMAQGYEELDRQDTLKPLQAVLDTNFWLATHVVTINIGYCAGLLAGAFGHVFLLGRAFGLKAGDPAFYTGLGRMIYGTLCFALLFSLLGTILGGIWANDSWGRFWGWDPKENGALMIVIWSLIALHARLGGYIQAHGMAVMSVVLTAIVAFSWWHVNNLGIGLHSYGFTQGVLDKLWKFYWFELCVVLTGFIWWIIDRRSKLAATD